MSVAPVRQTEIVTLSIDKHRAEDFTLCPDTSSCSLRLASLGSKKTSLVGNSRQSPEEESN